jgi:hypothetical protein
LSEPDKSKRIVYGRTQVIAEVARAAEGGGVSALRWARRRCVLAGRGGRRRRGGGAVALQSFCSGLQIGRDAADETKELSNYNPFCSGLQLGGDAPTGLRSCRTTNMQWVTDWSRYSYEYATAARRSRALGLALVLGVVAPAHELLGALLGLGVAGPAAAARRRQRARAPRPGVRRRANPGRAVTIQSLVCWMGAVWWY